MKNLVPAIAALCIPFAVAAQNVTSGGAHGTGNGMVFRQSGVATSSSGPVLAQSTADRIGGTLAIATLAGVGAHLASVIVRTEKQKHMQPLEGEATSKDGR